MTRSILVSLLVSMGSLAACGGGDGAGADAQPGGACGAIVQSCAKNDGSFCQDYDAPYDPTIVAAACSGSNVAPSANACARTGAVGGCQSAPDPSHGQAGCRTDWYFAPLTRASAMQACAATGGTFVEP